MSIVKNYEKAITEAIDTLKEMKKMEGEWLEWRGFSEVLTVLTAADAHFKGKKRNINAGLRHWPYVREKLEPFAIAVRGTPVEHLVGQIFIRFMTAALALSSKYK